MLGFTRAGFVLKGHEKNRENEYITIGGCDQLIRSTNSLITGQKNAYEANIIMIKIK